VRTGVKLATLLHLLLPFPPLTNIFKISQVTTVMNERTESITSSLATLHCIIKNNVGSPPCLLPWRRSGSSLPWYTLRKSFLRRAHAFCDILGWGLASSGCGLAHAYGFASLDLASEACFWMAGQLGCNVNDERAHVADLATVSRTVCHAERDGWCVETVEMQLRLES
jgi:hypothetical protein